MDEQIANKVEKLRLFRQEHIEMGKLFLSAHGGDLYSFDLLAVATLNRSMCLLRGFCDLMLSENFVSAAPLVRLQLDNGLRFFAGWLVLDPHEFALQILKGKQVKDICDAQGNKMTDRFLVEQFSQKEDARYLTLYRQTSGYVHLSNKHMFNAIGSEGKDGKILLKITDQDAFVPNRLYEEAINSFAAITQTILKYMYSWAYTKENPKVAKRDSKK